MRSMKYKKRKHRIKYNWLHIINSLNYVHLYDEFKADNDLKQHLAGKSSISENRLARAFVLKNRKYLPLDLSWAIKGKEQDPNPVFINWLR